jgi:hypothetical protein
MTGRWELSENSGGKLNLDEAFVDVTFASAKKGLAVGPARRGKGTKIVAVAADNVLPLAVCIC